MAAVRWTGRASRRDATGARGAGARISGDDPCTPGSGVRTGSQTEGTMRYQPLVALPSLAALAPLAAAQSFTTASSNPSVGGGPAPPPAAT